MKPIPLKNSRLKVLLDNIISDFFQPKLVDLGKKTRDRKDDLQPNNYGCSEEYLKEALKHSTPKYGFPRSCLGLGMSMQSTPPQFLEIFEPTQRKVTKIGTYLGTPVNALTMLYPDNGYIGWHHNGNAPGYNILFSYSQDGEGCFKWYEKATKTIHVIKDNPGWNVKVGYYPSEKTETDMVYWHCAETKKQRVSLAYILNHKDMWKNMIDTITDGDYDPAIIDQKGA